MQKDELSYTTLFHVIYFKLEVVLLMNISLEFKEIFRIYVNLVGTNGATIVKKVKTPFPK